MSFVGDVSPSTCVGYCRLVVSPWPSCPPLLFPQHHTVFGVPERSAHPEVAPSTADETPVSGVVPSVVIAWAYPVRRLVPLLTSHDRSPQHQIFPSLVTAQALLLELPVATATAFVSGVAAAVSTGVARYKVDDDVVVPFPS